MSAPEDRRSVCTRSPPGSSVPALHPPTEPVARRGLRGRERVSLAGEEPGALGSSGIGLALLHELSIELRPQALHHDLLDLVLELGKLAVLAIHEADPHSRLTRAAAL